MPHLLVIAHAPLATSLLAVATHVYPDCSRRLKAFDVPDGLSLDEVEVQLRALIETWGTDEGLILADVFGATPCNAALKAADGIRVRVVAGVNVPMLWRTLCYGDEALDKLVERAVSGAAQGVMQVAVPRRQNQASPTIAHDQVQHRHQQ